MPYPSIENVASLNEAGVREEIIAPFLNQLGYASGTNYNILREFPLKYPRIQLGRKKGKKDPLLRGRADYILEVDGSGRLSISTTIPCGNKNLARPALAFPWVSTAINPDFGLGISLLTSPFTRRRQ